MKFTTKIIAACAVFAWTLSVFAQEAAIRKNLAERLPNLPKIDEVSKTAMPGLFEVLRDYVEGPGPAGSPT